MLIPFLIDHIDTLGQGVSKIGSKVTFISKTLPGEKGMAKIVKSKKGVNFASIEEGIVDVASSLRITPPCPHYASCPGCHFLHTSYEQELLFKKLALQKSLKKINAELPIVIVKSPERFSYRNRLQLHYDCKKMQLGVVGPCNNKIIEIADCLLPVSSVRSEVKKMYKNNYWMQLLKSLPKQEQRQSGHVEIYQRGSDLRISWNENYARGGFSQVNNCMNSKLTASLKDIYLTLNMEKDSSIWDLFGGDGNLSNQLPNAQTVVIDKHIPVSRKGDRERFLSVDLLHAKGVARLLGEKSLAAPNLIILDPPRKGFLKIDMLLTSFSPQHIIYVSCNPQTLARDVGAISSKYHIKELQLIDLFPGTYHFETVALLSQR